MPSKKELEQAVFRANMKAMLVFAALALLAAAAYWALT